MMKTNSDKIEGIQLLRGVAALAVVLYHTLTFEGGAFGVDIFFVICGFIMMLVTEKRTDNFLKKRVIRILPLYWSVTCLFVFVALVSPDFLMKQGLFFEANHMIAADAAAGFSTERFVNSLLFVGRPAMVLPGWTLNMEMMFYAIFFISFRISHKNRGLIASIVVCAFVVVGGFVKTGTVFDQWTSPVFLEFAMGIMAYTLLKQGGFVRGELPKKNLRIFAGILSLAALASLFVYDLVVTPSYQEITPIRPAAYGVLSMICFMGCYVALLGMRLPRPLVGVGNISYSLYLTHIFVILFTNYVVYPDGAQYPFAIPVLLFNVVLSLLVAYASWKIIETKWGNYLSSKFLSRPSPFLSV